MRKRQSTSQASNRSLSCAFFSQSQKDRDRVESEAPEKEVASIMAGVEE